MWPPPNHRPGCFQGTGDPNMVGDQMLQLLALGQFGAGGGPGAGSNGVDVGPFGNIGQMAGY
jgi:hypothetical protein